MFLGTVRDICNIEMSTISKNDISPDWEPPHFEPASVKLSKFNDSVDGYTHCEHQICPHRVVLLGFSGSLCSCGPGALF